MLSQPRGNALLVGVGGSGKQSLARLASAMLNMQFVRLAITLVYGTKEFREDLKSVTQIAGVEGRDVVLVLDDSDIISER